MQFLSLGILLLLVLWAVLGCDWWSAARKLQWLKSVDFNQIDKHGVLYLKSRPDEIGPAAQGDRCLALWRSRSLAAYDLDSAQMALAQASGCSREELVALWAGNLAWLQGKREWAIQNWSQLSDVNLVSLGRSYVLGGHLERGLALLECVADRGAEDLPVVRRVQFHQTLGEVYESVGELEQAAAEYRKAWDLGGSRYEMAFILGKAYRGLGRCGDAIDVLEAGLEAKPAILRPQLDSGYYVELGQCYASLGNGELAQLNYLLALEALNLAQGQTPGLEFPMQQQRIEQLLSGLDSAE